MKIPKIKRVATKGILIVAVCFIVYVSIATPIIRNTTFNTLKPFLVDHIDMKLGNSSALMSQFFGYSNTAVRKETLSEDFQKTVFDYNTGADSEDAFKQTIAKQIEPRETTVVASATKKIVSTSYPAIYIEGKGLFCDQKVAKAAAIFIQSPWFRDYKENRSERMVYSPLVTSGEADDSKRYFNYVFSSNSAMNHADHPSPYYVFLFTDFAEIEALCEDTLGLKIKDYSFIGYSGEGGKGNCDVLYQNAPDSALDFLWVQERVFVDRQHYVASFEEKDSIYFSVLISWQSEGLRLVMRATQQDLQKLYNDNMTPLIILFISFFSIFIIIFISILSHIFKRLTILSKKMVVVQNGDYNVKIDDNSEDEIGQLVAAFNGMAHRIKNNINELIEQEKREKRLQYNLMVSSINPHFIYNTLNTATRLAELGRTQEVVEINDALINCMQDNLKMKSLKAYDTVEVEKNTLQQYIKIQNYLCDNSIELEFEVAPQNCKLEIPKFLLQPIIENSIVHGILLNVDANGNLIGGKIKVAIEKHDDRIQITIQDNGIGMTKESIDKYFLTDVDVLFNESTFFEHIGVLNIRTRLSYLYNDDYTFHVESAPGKGTKVLIEIPAKSAGSDAEAIEM